MEQYVLKNFQFVLSDGGQIDKVLLEEMLEKDGIRCSSEYELFGWLLQWIKQDFEERKAIIADVMQYIRFPLIPMASLNKIMSEVDFMTQNPTCKALLDEAIQYQRLTVFKQVTVQMARSQVRNISHAFMLKTPQPKRCFYWDFHLDCLDGGSLETPVRYEANRVIMEHYMYQPSVTVQKNYLVLCGGWTGVDELGCTDQCCLYDPRFSEWSSMPPMNVAKIDFPLVGIGNNLYTLGGFNNVDEFHRITAIEKYSFVHNKWTVMSIELPARFSGTMTAQVLEDKVYFMEGADQPTPDDEVMEFCKFYCFDPVRNTIVRKANLTKEFLAPMSTVVDTKMYVFESEYPGENGLHIDCYDSKTDQWQVIKHSASHPQISNRCLLIPKHHLLYFVYDYAYGADIEGVFNLQTGEYTLVQLSQQRHSRRNTKFSREKASLEMVLPQYMFMATVSVLK